MIVDEKGSTDFIHFPVEETNNLMFVLNQAEKDGDLEALQWAVRRLVWLHEMFKDDLCGSDEPIIASGSMKLFNSAYKSELTTEPPPPESIKNLVNFNLGEAPKKIGSRATAKAAR
jgi:hypothetical protein